MAGGIALQSSSGGTVTFTVPETSTSSTISLNFTNLKSPNGYQYLPGGIIIQWGIASFTAGEVKTIALPIAFPSAIVSASTSSIIGGLQYEYAAVYTGTSTTNIVIKNNVGVTQSAYWLAIGY